MRNSTWRSVLVAVLVGVSPGACGGGSFTSSGSEADASTVDAGAGGQAGSSGGTGGSATGGAAGAEGGSGGTAQTGGTGASETGGAGGTETGGTGGTGGTGTGGTGTGGAGGTSCPDFEHCQPASTPAPACGPCTQFVCEDLPHCCNDVWDWMCVLHAQALGECQCKGLVCTAPTFPTPSAGSCVLPSAYCNPLKAGAPCGEQQCVVNADSGQLHYQCAPIGDVPACDSCNPSAGKNCDRGFSCVAGSCLRLCCSAQDCGPDSVCATNLLPGSNNGLGICRRL